MFTTSQEQKIIEAIVNLIKQARFETEKEGEIITIVDFALPYVKRVNIDSLSTAEIFMYYGKALERIEKEENMQFDLGTFELMEGTAINVS